MKLKDEMREAAVVEMERMGWTGLSVLNAALAPLDTYEEVEVRPNMYDEKAIYMEGSDDYVSHDATCYTIYRKKQEPKPGVKELARQAVKAFASGGGKLILAMEALAEAVK